MINKTILEAQKMLTPSQNEMRVAAKNILSRFHQESSTLNNIVPDSTKASLIVFH